MNKSRRSPCPLACTLDLIGDKWTLLVVRDLASGKSRFKEFLQSPERIATNVLADRLARLVDAGLVDRHSSPERTGLETYRLTEKGRSLGPVLSAMAQWGLTHVEGTTAAIEAKF